MDKQLDSAQLRPNSKRYMRYEHKTAADYYRPKSLNMWLKPITEEQARTYNDKYFGCKYVRPRPKLVLIRSLARFRHRQDQRRLAIVMSNLSDYKHSFSVEDGIVVERLSMSFDFPIKHR